MKINLELNDLKNLYWAANWDATSSAWVSDQTAVVPGDLKSASLFVDYIYLDTDERRRFAQVSHEYLLLKKEVKSIKIDASELREQNPSPPCNSRHFQIAGNSLGIFHHVMRRFGQSAATFSITSSKKEGVQRLNVSGSLKDLRYSLVSHRKMEVLTIEQLQFTGDESTSTTSNKIKLNFNHPTKELVWVVQPDDNVASAAPFGAQWFNYTDDYDVTYTSTAAYGAEDATGGVGGVIAPHTTSTDVENMAGGMPGAAAGGANHVFVPTSFEGGANPVATAKIQLNGHDRFAEMDGRYFNLVQPYQHHENVPSKGINVYSFGLKPEEHQPSGTCNFSRIDSATLNLTLTPTTVNKGGSRTAKVRVFAVNYNVLRIMSGMGGLAYSN